MEILLNSLIYILPKELQIAVAIATILSSFAVIVYIIQTIMTRNQFQRQSKFQELQQKNNLENFVLLNQGYLAFEFLPQLITDKFPEGTKYAAGMDYKAIAFNATFRNVGRTPLTFNLALFAIYFNGAEKFRLPTTNNLNPVYPDQLVNMPFGGQLFDVTAQHLTISQIQALNITGKIIIKYHDFNSVKEKTIDRTFVVRVEDSNIIAVYNTINDTL